jgi:hypothetical protein
MKVVFKRYNASTDTYNVSGELSLIGDSLSWTVKPDDSTRKHVENGIMVEDINEGSKLLKPGDDPVAFLKALPINFNGTYFVASLVDEEDNVHKSSNFSMQDQGASGELGNQVGYPIKVDGAKEQASKTPQKVNMEPYYEKSILKSVVNEWFYSMEDGTTKTTSLANLKLSLINKFSKDGSNLPEQVEADFKALSGIVRKSEYLFDMGRAIDKWINIK